MLAVQAIAAAQSIAARLSAAQPGPSPTASAPGSYGNQPYSYADQAPQAVSLPGPPPGPPNGSAGPHSNALAAAQAVAARLSAQAAPSASNASESGGYGAPPPQTYTPTAQASAPQQSSESKQEAAIRAAEAVAARFSAQVAAPAAPLPDSSGSRYGQAPGGGSYASSTYSTPPPAFPSASVPAQDPVAAARAVAARLAGQMGQTAAPYPGANSAANGTPGRGGPPAQDPIAAAQAVAARLAARHGDTSMGGPPSNPYGGSNRGKLTSSSTFAAAG